MKDVLADIQSGAFANRWIDEYEEAGGATFKRLREQDRDHQIEQVGAELRAQMPFLDPVVVQAGEAQAAADRRRAAPGGGRTMTLPADLARATAPVSPPGTVRVFDTTLRDGEQAPGAGLTAAEKLEVARQLARLKVDVIEAGFPAASPGDFEAVQRIARETKGGIAVAALARCNDGDPQRAVEAIGVAERPHLHVFIATSDIHLKHKLRMTREQALAEAVRWVRYGARDARPRRRDRVQRRGRLPHRPRVPAPGLRGRGRGGRVDGEHPGHRRATRSRRSSARSSAGSSTSSARDATISVHCHNDLGLATANTLAAVQAGARQVEVTINGLGERAGNASLEEVVMALRTRPTQFPELGDRRPDRAHHRGLAAGQLPDRLRGPAEQGDRRRQRLRPRVGHPPGRRDQEPADLRDHDPAVGRACPAATLTIGKLSGRRGLQGKLRELGYDLEGEALDAIYRAGDRPRRCEEGGHRRRPRSRSSSSAPAEVPRRPSSSWAGA